MATRGEVQAVQAPLIGRAVPNLAQRNVPTLATAHSSHRSWFKSSSRGLAGKQQVQNGAQVRWRGGAGGASVAQVHPGATGTVMNIVDTPDRGQMAHVWFDGAGADFVPVASLAVLAAAPPSSGQVQDGAAAGPADADMGEWEPYPYKPGDEPIPTSIALVLFGELYRRQSPGGGFEYKRAWTWLNLLLIFVPLSFIANYATDSAPFTFIMAFFAIVPLAGLLGHFTEDLAGHVGSALGALLNASFGNATELIISVFAVKKSLFTVIKNSMLGSVMGNMLLVLGCAFLSRSVPNGTEERKREQARSALWTFNAESANVFASLLLLSAFALAIPTAYAQLHIVGGSPPDKKDIYDMSRATAIAMIFSYIVFLYFQVKHNEVFNASERGEEEGGGGGDEEGAMEVEKAGSQAGEDEEAPKMSKWFDITGLGFVTVLIAFVSEFLVDSLESATSSLGLSESWVAVILLPIIGNAAEHATAIVSSYKGDMEIAIGVAIGSSIQIAGFAVPVLVVVSWIYNGQDPGPLLDDDNKIKMCGQTPCPGALDMNFHPFSMTCMVLSVIVVNTIVTDGKGNWLEGICLLITYCIVGIAFWYVPENSDA
eukprot:Hpha_TRINITY_DN15143_c1_g3::TRINITY_DN15143_c1_g3_i1::g.127485::m.127485/K07300/chaA, CAX; Ca2+:H+ antiporter